MNLHDAQIREVLLPQLRQPGVLVVQEWGVVGDYASATAGTLIVDVAVVRDDTIEAFEIKSAADSLARLPKQVPLYGALFDRCTLITSRSHMAAAARLLCGPLSWWGLTLFEDGALTPARPAEVNPGARPEELLWSTELAPLIKRFGLHTRGTRHGKGFMLRRLREGAPRPELTAAVCATLRARADWRDADGISARRAERRARRLEAY